MQFLRELTPFPHSQHHYLHSPRSIKQTIPTVIHHSCCLLHSSVKPSVRWPTAKWRLLHRQRASITLRPHLWRRVEDCQMAACTTSRESRYISTGLCLFSFDMAAPI